MTRTPTLDLRRERLPNGVTLLVQRNRTAPAAALVTHVRAGFLDEPDELVGISHVLEHMLFKGTPTLAPGELAQRTKALGGSLNAYTSYDRTVYYASVPARHARAAIALQADQVQNPLLDAAELRRELGVIIQEARRKLDSPGAVAGETLHELLYATHRLRRWRIGVEATLEAFRRDDIAGYYNSRYVPERTIVALVADLDEDAVLDALREYWGVWSRPAALVPAGPAEQSAPQSETRRLTGDVALGELVLGWRAPGVLDATVPPLNVAAAILGLGRGSRFARQLREPGLVNSVGVANYGVVDAGVFAIGTELDPARIEPALGIIGSTVSDMGEREPDTAEFARAQTLLRARIRRRLERYESRAIALADAEALGDVTRLDREEADLLAVTPASVRDAARRWLTADGVSGVAYLPRDSGARFDAALLRDAVGASGATVDVHRGDGSAGRDIPKASARPERVERVASPARQLRPSQGGYRRAPAKRRPVLTAAEGPPERMSRPAVYHLELHGLDILTSRFGETGQSTLSVYRPRSALETPATAGIAALAVRTMLRGTERLDAAELAFAMESLGGSLSPSLGADVLGFGVTVLSEHVRTAAGLLAEVLHQPRFDARSVDIERGLLLDDARAVADDMVRFPMQLAFGVAFNDTGYGSPSLGTPESITTFDATSIRTWHAELLRGGRTTIVAVGDADPDQLADQLAEAFVIPNEVRDRTATGRSLTSFGMTAGTRTERRDRKQSALAMVFPGPSRTDPDRFAAETWSAIAAGLGGRLFESLRSARSLAYSVMANSWQRRGAGALLTYIATDPARLDEARDAMLEELALFRREPPSDVELNRATAMLAGHAEMSRQTAGAFAGEIADAWLLGDGLSELDDPAAPYRGVTVEAVHAVAARSLDPALRAEGVVAAATTE